MPEAATGQTLLRLMAWLSPAFPVGSFAYSSGLERAAHDGLVEDAETLGDWIAELMKGGGAWNDAVLFCEAWRLAADSRPLADIRELAEALAGSLERHRETRLQGGAFAEAAAHWPGLRLPDLSGQPPFCIAVGAVAGVNGIPLHDACTAWLQAVASGQIQAAIRLSVLGQGDAVRLLGTLETLIVETADRASRSTLDDLGSAAIAAEIAAMKHEMQPTRLFRS